VKGAAALLSLLLPACALPSWTVEPRLGPVALRGRTGLDEGAASPDNSRDEVGLENDTAALGLRGDAALVGRHLTVTLQESAHDGDGTLGADLMADGTTIAAGTDVSTDLTLGIASAALTFDQVLGPNVGLGFGLAVLDVDLETRTIGGTDRIAIDERVPLPFLAGRVGTRLGPVEVEGLASALYVSALGQRFHYLDLDLRGRLQLFTTLPRVRAWLTFGLRRTDLDLDFDVGSDEASVDWVLLGPYIGVQVGL
jgi:hypothetical protein